MLDLSAFGPWRDGICDLCQTLQLVTGPDGGEQRCGPCWNGETPARPHRVITQAESLFDPAPFEKRGEGA